MNESQKTMNATYMASLEEELGKENLSILDLSAPQIEKLAIFLSLIHKTNEKFNLTSSTEPKLLVGRHTMDSILLAQVIKELPHHERIIDIGSGGGFPAIILALCLPQSKFTLIDSTQKKCAFLQEVANKLQISHRVTVLNGRAEDLAHKESLREQFQIATAKAVASLKISAELASGFLAPQGVFITQKTINRLEQEIQEARPLLRKLFFQMAEPQTVSLVNEELQDFCLLLLTKEKRVPESFPRSWKQITQG